MSKKSQRKSLLTYTLLEQDNRWEVTVGVKTYTVQKEQDNSCWIVLNNHTGKVINKGQNKTLSECLVNMGQKNNCLFVLESEKDADIRIFGKPIACKRY